MKDINIAQTILNKRKEKGLLQDDIASYIGVSKASVSKWETGQSYPDISLLPRLATYFGISIDELMGYTPQITKADIRALYQKFSADFTTEPFEKVMDDVKENIKKYYACYPFLLQMAILTLNHCMLAENEEAINATVEDAIVLCRRIKTESDDLYLTREANSIEAMSHLMANKPIDVINLLHDVTLHPLNQDEMVLASAYEVKGDIDSAKRVVQITSYQYILCLMGSAVKLLPLYKNETDRFEEILRRSLVIANAYNLDKLHPNAFIQLSLTAAMCLAEQGNHERALDLLRKSVDSYGNFNFPAILQGDDYFDLLDDWFADFDLGENAPIDAKLINGSFLEMLKNPVFSPLFDRPEYKSILTRVENNYR